MAKILIVEDDISMNNIINDYLCNSGYEVVQAIDGEEAIDKFNSNDLDLVILDVMMPKKDGFEVLDFIRKKSDILVIMLTALETEKSKLKGYDLGTDDYITKPFSPRVLVAKVNSLLKRNNVIKDSRININDIELNISERTLFKNNEKIELTKTEFDLLELLIKNYNKVLDREVILSKVWGYEYFGDSRVVDTNIKNLRKKLLDDNNIETVIGVGYKYVKKDK